MFSSGMYAVKGKLDTGEAGWRGPVRATALIAAAFFYFLIFAQFAFLERLEAVAGGDGVVFAALGAMGVAGALSSVTVGFLAGRLSLGKLMMASFAGCAIAAAVASRTIEGVGLAVAIGALVGVSLGSLTVSIAAVLPQLIEGRRIGVWVGMGVGIAYGASNLPWIFGVDAVMQSCLAAVVATLGVGIAWRLPESRLTEAERGRPESRGGPFLFGWTGLVAMMLLFAGLVFFDSAAFYLIQETPEIKEASWQGDGRLLWIGAAHFIAAVLAGFALDRGRILTILGAAFALLAVGTWWLRAAPGSVGWLPTSLYAAGVSLYSTTLVAYGALGRYWSDRPSIGIRAGVVFAFGGWIASGLGIGMVEDLGGLPDRFSIASLIGFGLLLGATVMAKSLATSSKPA